MSEAAALPSAVMPTYNRLAIDFERGEGCHLYDSEGNRYLDAVSGVAVCALGHGHAGFTRAIATQAARLVHTSNLYGIPLQRELAHKLCDASGMENAFFCNSGAEANEAAIKLARMYGHNKGVEVPAIIVMEGAFHGRTLGALTATHSTRRQAGFGPLLKGFIRVPYNDPDAVEDAMAAHANVVAVLVEPIQGESGVRTCAPDYLERLRALCDRHDCLLMLDEVQTGNGRTGRYFAFQHTGMLPDVLTTAKGMGNGFPIGACLARGKAAGIFQPGHHATTFGGSPLACAAGLAVNEAILKEELLDNAREQGNKILEGLEEALSGLPHVKEVRGLGLLIGVELFDPCQELVEKAACRGLLINIAAGNVVRILPPLIINAEEAGRILATVAAVIREFGHG